MKIILSLLLSLNTFALNLKFNEQIIRPENGKVELGGLSGIRYNEKTKTLYAISDDRSSFAPARFYEFKIDVVKNKLNIHSPKKVTLKDLSGKHFSKSKIDFEDIDFDKNGNILITDEGNINGIQILPPRILVFNPKGKMIEEIEVAKELIPIKKNGHFVAGTRDNMSLEALSLSSDKSKLFTMPENAIKQDGPEASLDKACFIPLYEYHLNSKGKYKIKKKYSYPFGPIDTIENRIKSAKYFAGVTAILSTEENKLLVLERIYYPILNTNTIKLFNVTLYKDGALKKVLNLNLDKILPYFKNHKSLDNLEGLTFGPRLENGHRTLIIVSDNNFRSAQRTHFIVFEIEE